MNSNLSPFKFLDAYRQEDSDVFFGRETETGKLYDALSGVRQLLLYGPSGSGKTSLIECGFRNQFSDADWFALTIRRGQNLIASFYNAVNDSLLQKLPEPGSRTSVDPDAEFGHAIATLFAQRYQPVYLLFDQFEELLILGTDSEKTEFFKKLYRLIRFKVPCRVILIMREEFIGYLSQFEHLCPGLFNHRFRLEKMGRKNVEYVLNKILTAERYLKSFDVEQAGRLVENILLKLPDNKQEIDLAHVQVFLGELWDRACAEQGNREKPLLHPLLIEETDNLESVLDVFLKKQFNELEPVYGEKAPLEALAAMITERNTKLQISHASLNKELEKDEVILKAPLSNLLTDLEKRRIIRTLKTGDETQYEISHDILALLVGQSKTEDMRLREKAEDIYKLYEDRTGNFSQDDLNYLQPYAHYRKYPDTLKQKMEESRKKIESEKREKEQQQKKRLLRARIFAAVISILALGAIGLARYGFQQKGIADKERDEAYRQEKTARENLVKAYDSEIKRIEKEISVNKINEASLIQFGANDVVERVRFIIDSLSNHKNTILSEKEKLLGNTLYPKK